MAIQIGKYKRPGIFIEEFDNSVISTPLVEGITNMVIGVSKKGPVNTPVLINTAADLESVFGQLDRGLERKGSFFHRTALKMLETSPVFAMNLLMTDDNLDKIEYQSLSTSSDYENDIERDGSYRRFFDTTGFWKRDTESFVNITKTNTGYNDRLLSITNLSDKYVTVFIVKSQLTSFDRSLIDFYGSTEKVPPYVNPVDWASDYMVDVIIVSGDWSDYKKLSVDSKWSAYFNASGLRKEQLRSFANDKNVTLLSYYEGLSLIPYFRDFNNRNIFIETVINRDTDKTGIFCAFNNELAEADFFNGKLDLIGHTIAGKNEGKINFLSYNESISEEVSFKELPLDRPGNVVCLHGDTSLTSHFYGDPLLSGVSNNPGNRTAWFSEGYVYNVMSPTASSSSSTNTELVFDYTIHSGSYLVVNDEHVPLNTTGSDITKSLKINVSSFKNSATLTTYVSAVVLTSSGEIKVVNSQTGITTGTDFIYPSVSGSDIVLSSIEYKLQSGTFSADAPIITNITVNDSGDYIPLENGVDYTITHVGNGSLKVEFLNTNSPVNVKKYGVYRRFKAFSKLVSWLDSSDLNKMTMVLSASADNEKYSMSGMTITDIVSSDITKNKSFVLNTGLDSPLLSSVISNGFLCIYKKDDEFTLGYSGISTTNAENDGENGVVGKYSEFYSKYYNGNINTGDYFYNNRTPKQLLIDGGSIKVTFFDGETLSSITGLNTGTTSSFAGYDYIMFESDEQLNFEIFDKITISGSELNSGSFTIDSEDLGINGSVDFTLADGTALTGIQYIYRVVEETQYEVVNNVTMIKDNNKVHYLKMFLVGDVLNVSFMDESLESPDGIKEYDGSSYENGVKTSNTIGVVSQDTNYKQTLEIETPTGYVQVPNKVLVNAERYTEVKTGDFLEASYDASTLKVGEYPRKLTRILSKKLWLGDSTLVEITCDSPIKKIGYNGDYQSTRYKSVENYATTYKAISLKGFRIREASLPDGSESKQNSILNLVAKGTPLFKAVTNKEAVDFRYLIDTFGLGLTERSKQQLVDICGERLDCFGFLNVPSMRSFKNSSSPTFVNSEGVLQTEFIAKGADPESGPAFLYSFGDGAGTTCVGYFLPYVTVNDNGRPIDVPPSSHVATTYMRKHISSLGGITPWTIAAGVTNGRVTNIAGLEIDFNPTDIEWLNGAQMNPIVFKRNRGNVIETENTAQTLSKSALSYIHVREVLIELERELSRMLLDFQWNYNTPDIRAEIKLRADLICETYVSKNGLYNYFNKMDEENNTSEIIDNQIGVLDTYVEPIKGMGVIVNNVTILRTGAIAAGGFL